MGCVSCGEPSSGLEFWEEGVRKTHQQLVSPPEWSDFGLEDAGSVLICENVIIGGRGRDVAHS